MTMKHVYIIEAGNGHKKIGVASDVDKRINTLKTGISTGVKSVWITDKVSDARDIERMLHQANSSIRLNGEWFDGKLNLCGIEFFPPELDRYLLIDKMTGKVIDLKQHCSALMNLDTDIIEINVDMISELINICGSGQSKVLSYLISHKDTNNIINKTQSEIIEITGASEQTVKKAFKSLISKGMIKKIRNGTYMLTPLMLRNGDNQKGAMLLRIWSEA